MFQSVPETTTYHRTADGSRVNLLSVGTDNEADFACFRDHRPAGDHHFLVVPKKHMRTLTQLNGSHVPLVRKLEEIGLKVDSI